MSRIIIPGKSAHPDFALPGRQPVGPVALDLTNPLGRKILHAVDYRAGTYRRSVKGGSSYTLSGTVDTAIGAWGQGRRINTGSVVTKDVVTVPTFGTPLVTFFTLVTVNAATPDGGGGAGVVLASVRGAADRYIKVIEGASNTLEVIAAGSGSRSVTLASPVSFNTKLAVFAWTDGSLLTAQLNRETPVTNASATTFNFTNTFYDIWHGNDSSTSNCGDHTTYLTVVFAGTLTAAERESLVDDPWQLFRPANDPIFFIPSAGGGVTGSLAATESGSDTAALVARTYNGKIFVRSTDGSDLDNGFSWASAKATLGGAAGIDSAGDRIYVSDNHTEASSGDIALAGTVVSPILVISVDDVYDDDPPLDISPGATVSTAGTPAISGYAYFSGITFKTATAASNYQWILNPYSVTAGCLQVYEDCSFEFQATGATARAYVNGATASNANDNYTIWTDCDYYTSNASGGGISVVGRFEWNGGSILASHVATSAGLFVGLAAGRPAQIEVSGVDLSNMGQTAPIFGYSAALTKGVVRNCKLPASWSGSLVTGTAKLGDRYELYNCDSADTNYRLWIEDYAGTIKHSATVYNDAGASDGTTRISWVMTSAANVEYPTILLRSPEIVRWNETVGSAVTVTVEIVHNSQGSGSPTGLLYDDEIWLEVMYLGTSGYPLGTWITDCKANVLAPAAAQATSTASWTGDAAGWDTQKLSVSITPREKGFIHARIVVGKPSITVYVDPLLTVA